MTLSRGARALLFENPFIGRRNPVCVRFSARLHLVTSVAIRSSESTLWDDRGFVGLVNGSCQFRQF